MKLASLQGGLRVLLGERLVGTLALIEDGRCAFQYDSSWLVDGYSLNPYSLPLSPEVFVPNWEPFGGLFGVFHDSLPDGWGALLLNRKLRSEGIDPTSIDSLVRLSIVGATGRGALCYEPQAECTFDIPRADLDELAAWSLDVLQDRPVKDLDALYVAAGSSGGARPKAYIEDETGHWLVKFPSRMDPQDIGVCEYAYALAARECGIATAKARLFPSKVCKGYFGSRRFDFDEMGKRIHMLSASGIVEVSHQVPSLDYESLFQISYFLTSDREEAKQLYRLMCFNVFAHNQDDHSNNFAWLCRDGVWQLAPAYDLTYSTSYGNQHATSVLGAGNPTMSDVLALAREVGLPKRWARTTAQDIQEVCACLLRSCGLV